MLLLRWWNIWQRRKKVVAHSTVRLHSEASSVTAVEISTKSSSALYRCVQIVLIRHEQLHVHLQSNCTSRWYQRTPTSVPQQYSSRLRVHCGQSSKHCQQQHTSAVNRERARFRAAALGRFGWRDGGRPAVHVGASARARVEIQNLKSKI